MVWTCDKDWVKKCKEFRVEGRRPRRTCLESVEADMAELEINSSHYDDSLRHLGPREQDQNTTNGTRSKSDGHGWTFGIYSSSGWDAFSQ